MINKNVINTPYNSRVDMRRTEMINDYIDRQLKKQEDAEQRIQEQLDYIEEMAFGGEDNGTMDFTTND
jgi:hypothetical protein